VCVGRGGWCVKCTADRRRDAGGLKVAQGVALMWDTGPLLRGHMYIYILGAIYIFY
jgi:hypothetical protein